jgi:hypothetical protein
MLPLSVAVPSINNKTALDFSFVEQNFNSPLNYQITALNLACNGNSIRKFYYFKSGNYRVWNEFSFAAADFNNDNTNCICEICAHTTGVFLGQINHEATNATTKTVSLTA